MFRHDPKVMSQGQIDAFVSSIQGVGGSAFTVWAPPLGGHLSVVKVCCLGLATLVTWLWSSWLFVSLKSKEAISLVSLGLVSDDRVCKQQWVRRLEHLPVQATAALAFFWTWELVACSLCYKVFGLYMNVFLIYKHMQTSSRFSERQMYITNVMCFQSSMETSIRSGTHSKPKGMHGVFRYF